MSGSSGVRDRSQQGCLGSWSDQDIILLQGDRTRFIFDVQASLFMNGTFGTMSRLDEVCKGTVGIEKSGFSWMKISSFRI